MAHGERFLYHSNYVNKEAEEISSHFGEVFRHQVFELIPNANHWTGPISSIYGVHLVLVSSRRLGYQPSLDEVRPQVVQDAERFYRQKQLSSTIDELVARYRVSIATDLHDNQIDVPVQPSDLGA